MSRRKREPERREIDVNDPESVKAAAAARAAGELAGSGPLSLEVTRHPSLDEDAILAGSLSIAGRLNVGADLNDGDRLTVQVAGPDGEVVAAGSLEVAPVGFAPIKFQGERIGTERKHKAKVVPD